MYRKKSWTLHSGRNGSSVIKFKEQTPSQNIDGVFYIKHKEVKIMQKIFTRKEAANFLGISIATLDTARTAGAISFVQYVPNGCVYFTSEALQEYIAKCTHRALPPEKRDTYRKQKVR